MIYARTFEVCSESFCISQHSTVFSSFCTFSASFVGDCEGTDMNWQTTWRLTWCYIPSTVILQYIDLSCFDSFALVQGSRGSNFMKSADWQAGILESFQPSKLGGAPRKIWKHISVNQILGEAVRYYDTLDSTLSGHVEFAAASAMKVSGPWTECSYGRWTKHGKRLHQPCCASRLVQGGTCSHKQLWNDAECENLQVRERLTMLQEHLEKVQAAKCGVIWNHRKTKARQFSHALNIFEQSTLRSNYPHKSRRYTIRWCDISWQAAETERPRPETWDFIIDRITGVVIHRGTTWYNVLRETQKIFLKLKLRQDCKQKITAGLQ